MSGDDEKKPEKIKKYINNICEWEPYPCMEVVVLFLGFVLIIFSICCISKCCSSNAQSTKETLTITENKTDDPCIKSTAELSTHIPWNNNPYFFLFLIACLGLIGAVIFFLCNSCREKIKQALLTYAYDEALEKLKDDRDKHMVNTPKGDMDLKTTKNPTPTEEIITMNRYYKKQLTKIFETYCQNITSK